MTQPASLFFVKRHQNSDHAMKRGQGIANAHAYANRQTAWLCTEVPQTTHGFSHNTKSRLVFVRARLTIATDAQHDQSRIEVKQGVRA